MQVSDTIEYSSGTGIARRRTCAPAGQGVIAARADKACRPGWFALFRLAGRRRGNPAVAREKDSADGLQSLLGLA